MYKKSFFFYIHVFIVLIVFFFMIAHCFLVFVINFFSNMIN